MRDLFNSTKVCEALKQSEKTSTSNRQCETSRVISISFNQIPVSLISTRVFDRLQQTYILADDYQVEEEEYYNSPALGGSVIVKKTGHIGKTFDTAVDDFVASDLLQLFAVKNLRSIKSGDTVASNRDDILSSQSEQGVGLRDRCEFLFLLLFHLVIGGQMNQFEDVLEPYVVVAAAIYKKLLRVQRKKDNMSLNKYDCKTTDAQEIEEDEEEKDAMKIIEIVNDVYDISQIKWESESSEESNKEKYVSINSI